MKKMNIITIIYIVGLLVFPLTDICEINYLYYIAVGIGVIGSLVSILAYKKKV